MKCLGVGALLLLLIAESNANLEVVVDEVNTTSREFCATQMLTFRCTVATSGYAWSAGTLLGLMDGTVAVPFGGARNTEIINGFILTAEGIGSNRTSTLQVNASSGLSGTVKCIDSGDPTRSQETTVRVYDPLTTPISVATTTDYQSSVNLTIRSDVTGAANCISAYGVQVDDLPPIDVSTNGFVEINVTDLGAMLSVQLNLCNTSYNISVHTVACINGDIGEANYITFQPPSDIFQEMPSIENVSSDGAIVSFRASFICTNAIIEGTVSLGSFRQSNSANLNDTSIEFSSLSSGQSYSVRICAVLPEISKELVCRNIPFMTNHTTFPSDSSDTVSPAASTATTETELTPTPFPIGAIIGICVGVVVVLIGLTIIAVSIYFCCIRGKNGVQKDDSEKLETGGPATTYNDVKNDTDGATSHDVLPTYQDPQTIKREAAGPSGAVYTVVEKKKGSKKNEKSEEMAMYSVVDKDAKQQEGLVYADIAVKNPTRSSRSRPPAPPGVTQPDANEPVVYSTVDTTKH